ncbi:glycoside hydrolase family 26 protein [Kitasatospora sp. NBC_01302]|uniref:glycoside hydrolase family 26 protein n=1 Tax=Kitasatospora sp. NBC_01302 TaxID=2903575 RepID=UPI002E128E6A|nr:glycosyl hydrolase [Kitasatospora sp. NBC_01302]
MTHGPIDRARPARRRRTGLALFAVGMLLAGLTGCSTFSAGGRAQYNADGMAPQPLAPTSAAATTGAGPSASAKPAPDLPYDVRPLLDPAHKYFGVAAEGAPDSMQSVQDYTNLVGKKPNLVEFYSAWGDPFDGGGSANAWNSGALPFMSWEPKTVSLADIAAGKSDDYIRQVATAIRQTNRPLALSFGHEMNGDWSPWGNKHATPADFVAAWRHIHDIFQNVGATSVIWVWSPNQTNIAHNPLQPYWPGDGYVDWVGVIGYYGQSNLHTFKTLFEPTLDEIRVFTAKPFLIAETASSPGPGKGDDIDDLFSTVEARSDILGFVWFNFHKNVAGETNWRVDSSPQAQDAFRHDAADPRFGFDVRQP